MLKEDVALDLVVQQLLRAACERGFVIVTYCLMPDHGHLVVDGERDESDCLAFIKLAKQYSAYYFNQARDRLDGQKFAQAFVKKIARAFYAPVGGGDTYVFAPDTSRAVAIEYFMGPFDSARSRGDRSLAQGKPEISSWVAEIEGEVAGMYKLIPNYRDLGSHVANASFMVDPAAQGKGVGRAMGEHCLAQARQAGYQAMQFNFVVSTNTAGVELWKRLGFSIVGTLPKAFNHAQLGLVDAFVMHRFL